MKDKLQSKVTLPAFNREAVFAAVDESNRRFEGYTKEQRKAFADEARAQKQLVTHEARRPRH